MALAFCISQIFSKDPHTQIGAVIVDVNNIPLGYGYNGPPRNIPDEQVDWSRPQKYLRILHSETNAILHSHGDLRGATLYVNACPCVRCMLEIVACGIKKVVYFDLHTDGESSINDETRKEVEAIARLASVIFVKFSGNLNFIRDMIMRLNELGIFY